MDPAVCQALRLSLCYLHYLDRRVSNAGVSVTSYQVLSSPESLLPAYANVVLSVSSSLRGSTWFGRKTSTCIPVECEGRESRGSGLPSRAGFLPGWAGRQRRWHWNRTRLRSSHCASAQLVITGAHAVSIPLWFQVPRVGLRRSLSTGTSRSQLSGHQWRSNFTALCAPFSKVNWSEQEDTPSCCGSTCMGPSLWGGLGAVEPSSPQLLFRAPEGTEANFNFHLIFVFPRSFYSCLLS